MLIRHIKSKTDLEYAAKLVAFGLNTIRGVVFVFWNPIECFADLDKFVEAKLGVSVWLWARPNFRYWPKPPQKMSSLWKWPKVTSPFPPTHKKNHLATLLRLSLDPWYTQVMLASHFLEWNLCLFGFYSILWSDFNI